MSLNCVLCRYDEAGHWCAIPCGCVFHYDCLVISLAKTKSCPDCKKPCIASDIIKLYVNPAEDNDVSTQSEADLKRKIIEIEKKLRSKECKLDEILKQNAEISSRTRKLEADSKDSNSLVIQLETYTVNLKARLKELEHKQNEIPKYEEVEVNSLFKRIESLKKISVVLKQSKTDVADLIEMQLSEVDSHTYNMVASDFVLMLCCLEHELEEKKKIKCSYCTMLENKYRSILSRYIKSKEEIPVLKQSLKKKKVLKNGNDENLIKTQQFKRASADIDDGISIDFSTFSKKINKVVLDRAQPSLKPCALKNNFTQKVNVVNSCNPAVSVTRVGYNGLGGHESVVMRSNPPAFIQKKGKKTFTECSSMQI